MKIRMDFVTNSSSSSFLIAKKHLTENQIKAIINHSELGEKLGMKYSSDQWMISETKHFIYGYTSMDNFSMYDFFGIIGISGNHVSWDSGINSEKAEELLMSDLEEFEENDEETLWEEYLSEITD